ncbi:ectoine/hydroxyectoine ABC transporter permease subunit EhuC [Paenibacillus sp. MWE-103]|uniref:Ectoine/hydroxyectoine ABC transporter permease subunit EhuC n=2 Tax=Paenibacillus artemisiicola TaxID=1172618 RepID=A0ABS3WBQ6_9BACL|nr:ectoine/hydroxyectoine ABC transporter permease subunit EhuC [Paenibacillus artemisiicola]
MTMHGLDWLPLIASGINITVKVALLSAALALMLSGLAGLGSLSRFAAIRVLCRSYIQVFRSVSLLILLFWLYFALPFAGVGLSKLLSAVLAIGLNIGAYGAEIVRSAVEAIPKGQLEASTALNLTPWQRLRLIVLPQAFVRMMPPMGNLMIELLKSTSLIYFITLADLTYQAMVLRNNYYSWTPAIFGLLLLTYFLLSACIIVTVRVLERKFSEWR